MKSITHHRKLETLLVIGSGLLIYLLGTRSFTGDGLDYSVGIASGEGMWHPHHLLFIPMNNLMLRLFSGLGWEINAFGVAQIHNAIFAGIGIGAFYRIQNRIWKGDWMQWVFLAGLLFSFSYWTYSTQVEVYVPSLCFLLLLIRGGKPAWRVLYLALAVLYHQANVIFILPLLLQAVLAGNRKELLREVLLFVSAGILVIGMYFYGMWQQEIPLGINRFFAFTFSYELTGHPGWGTWENVDLSGLKALFSSQLEGLMVPWTPGLKWLVWPIGILILGILGTWPVLGKRATGFVGKDSGTVDQKNLWSMGWLVWMWVVVYLFFFWWWLPSEGEFSVLVVPGLLILASLLLAYLNQGYSWGKWLRWMVVAPVFLMVLWNGRTFLKARFEPNKTRLEAEWISQVAGDCIVFADYHLDTHLRFFANRESEGMESWMNQYYGVETHPDLSFKDGACYLIGLRHLDPNWKSSGHDGFSDPELWQSFVWDLFGVKDQEVILNDSSFAERNRERKQYEVLEFGGEAYFMIHSQSVIFEGESAFWQGLDASVEGIIPEHEKLFGTWYDRKKPSGIN